MDVDTLLTVLLSAGGTAFIATLFNGIRSLREGVRGREKEAITNIAAWGEDNAKRADKAEDDRDYYRGYNGMLIYQLRTNGIEPVPPPERKVGNV
jgi:hypothetical protein